MKKIAEILVLSAGVVVIDAMVLVYAEENWIGRCMVRVRQS